MFPARQHFPPRFVHIVVTLLLITICFAHFPVGAARCVLAQELAVAKSVVPDAASLDESRAIVRNQFAAQLRSARTLRQRAALSKVLLQAGQRETNPARAYALFLYSKEQAVGGRDARAALQSIAACEQRFQMDGLAAQAQAVQSLLDSARSDEQRGAAIDAVVDVMQRATAERRFDVGLPLVKPARKVAQRSRDAKRATKIDAFASSMEQAKAQWTRLRSAQTRLKENPSDPEAHYLLGIQCFTEKKWNDGVKHFTQAAQHPSLAAVASLDARGAKDVDEFIVLANAWKSAAESDPERGLLRNRALYWAHRAIPELQGAERAALEKQAAGLQSDLRAWTTERASATSSYATSTSNSTGQTGAGATTAAATNGGSPKNVIDAHKGAVHAICFSEQQQAMATCGADGKIRLWGLADQRLLLVLEGHEGPVYDVAFSPDGRLLASAGDDKTLRVWNLPKLESIQPGAQAKKVIPAIFRGHTTRLRGVGFFPDGSTIATCADDRRVAFWNVSTGAPIVREQHEGIVYDIAVATRGGYAATVGEDRLIRIWRGSVAAPPLVGHVSKIFAVAFSSSGTTIASAGEDKQIILWDLKKRAKSNLPRQESTVTALAFGRQSDLLAVVTRNKQVEVWRAAAAKQHCRFSGHKDEVMSVAFAPNDEFLATGDRNGQVFLWRLP